MVLNFGLLGYPLKNKFSVDYFTQKFKSENLAHTYQNFEFETLSEIQSFIRGKENLGGLNVTKPYKEKVIALMDELSEEAQSCGALNCIQFLESGKLKGHNTDVYGFRKSLENFIGSDRKIKALVLGNGGASKAVCFVLNKLNIPYLIVSRRQIKYANEIDYSDVNLDIVEAYKLIINTTPVGMFPDEKAKLGINFDGLGPMHFCFDLIYLPEKTEFLLEAERKGAQIKNGLEMLHLQAEEAYRIWMTG